MIAEGNPREYITVDLTERTVQCDDFKHNNTDWSNYMLSTKGIVVRDEC